MSNIKGFLLKVTSESPDTSGRDPLDLLYTPQLPLSTAFINLDLPAQNTAVTLNLPLFDVSSSSSENNTSGSILPFPNAWSPNLMSNPNFYILPKNPGASFLLQSNEETHFNFPMDITSFDPGNNENGNNSKINLPLFLIVFFLNLQVTLLKWQ